MTPGSNPPTVGDDTFSQACARILKSPVIVTDIGDGALLVEPLHFHRLVASGRGLVKISPVHTALTASNFSTGASEP